jgi:hypothetical protein
MLGALLVATLLCSPAQAEDDGPFLAAAEEALDENDLEGASNALRKATEANPTGEPGWAQLKEVLEEYRIELNLIEYPLLDAEVSASSVTNVPIILNTNLPPLPAVSADVSATSMIPLLRLDPTYTRTPSYTMNFWWRHTTQELRQLRCRWQET